MSSKNEDSKDSSNEDEKFPLPIYKKEDDIYSKEKEEHFEEDDELGNPDVNLDIPGSELDDEDEKIGEEDEENNYYSLGGDDHNDLEEDNPE
ncbi:MAG: hypothetical protein ACRDE5_00340 [Ginsengibacter sp.]